MVVRKMGNNSLGSVHHIPAETDFATNHKLLRQIRWRAMTADAQLCICPVLHSRSSLDGALKPLHISCKLLSDQSVDQHNLHNFTSKCKAASSFHYHSFVQRFWGLGGGGVCLAESVCVCGQQFEINTRLTLKLAHCALLMTLKEVPSAGSRELFPPFVWLDWGR